MRAREPVAVGCGDERVVAAVLEMHRDGAICDIEAPRLHEREHVIDPPVNARGEGVEQLCSNADPVPLHLRYVSFRHLVRVAQEIGSAGRQLSLYARVVTRRARP